MGSLHLRLRLMVLLAATAILGPGVAASDRRAVPVRHPEGLVHGFLALSTVKGVRIADGDLIQSVNGDRVTTRLVFKFKDGSIHDETAVFSQRQTFRLISDHLVQKGRSFPQSIDMTIDSAGGQVTVRYADEDGHQQAVMDRIDLPVDLANGIILTLLKNVAPGAPPPTLSMIAATPKPRLVTLHVSSAGQESFATGSLTRKATHYVVKVDVGGFAGLVAPLVGKQPPDSQVWILDGDAPAFVKSEQPLFNGGPMWRIELVSPTW